MIFTENRFQLFRIMLETKSLPRAGARQALFIQKTRQINGYSNGGTAIRVYTMAVPCRIVKLTARRGFAGSCDATPSHYP